MQRTVESLDKFLKKESKWSVLNGLRVGRRKENRREES